MVNKAIIDARKKKGLTQQELADKLGISKGMVSMLESGERTGTAKMMSKYADYFGITVDALFFADKGNN
ncbi:helix-turn-helix transcriptional regulator [Lactobacillus jensenii]|uniref:helix-turn-helix transcriptional regulator n=1 Tax=Lactobacillus jensenii TaxID=109790 RepID=UPI0011981B3B|nr:helix-turn-helix transcriptional regulator [Lactobacillus jensenii]MDX5103560.1 helix-turn-helix transcriptional regulator [Lactobacillus jensenii]MDX5115454.1 helix-turn-helix transcriptional regulator [Lactobacillus jensenii]TVU95144.1 helix-turn-helix transcriptional regulator [Lactobacillus jensenii]